MSIINKDLTENDIYYNFTEIQDNSTWCPSKFRPNQQTPYGKHTEGLCIKIVKAYLNSINITDVKNTIKFIKSNYGYYNTKVKSTTPEWFDSYIKAKMPGTQYDVLYKCCECRYLEYLTYTIIYDLKLTELNIWQ